VSGALAATGRTPATLAPVALAAALACGTRAADPPPRPFDPTSLVSAKPIAAPSPRERDDEALFRRVARARGLDARRVPKVDDVARAELVARALEQVRRHTSERSRDAEARLWTCLELLPPELDWDTALRTALEQHLDGFYDPDRQSVVIDRALTARARRRVLAHELVHALTDQHFALAAHLADDGDSADGRAALLSLAEGDAETLVGTLSEGGSENDAPSSIDGIDGSIAAPSVAVTELPEVVTRALAAAYLDGAAAVRRHLDAGGWSAVDALYRNPPSSTHELLHDQPSPKVSLASPTLPAELTATFTDTLGEQTWRTVLETWLPLDAAADIASAWRADRLTLLDGPDARALVWEIRADIPHAIEAIAAARSALRLTPSPGDTRRATDFACRAHRDGGALGQWRQGPSSFFAWLSSRSEPVRCNTLRAWASGAPRPASTEDRPGSSTPHRSPPTQPRRNESAPR
jgi:hypothetical protein